MGRLGKDHGNNGDDTAQRERGGRRAERAGWSEQSGQSRLTGPASGPKALRSLPFEFLRLGDERRIGAHPAGRIGGPAAQAFEFTPIVVAADRGAGSSDHSAHPYLVAVVELGFRVPWLAICARSVNQSAQQSAHQSAHRFYPGRRSLDLITSDRHVSRDYRLYADDFSQVGALLDGPVRAWLPGALSARAGRRRIAAIEASGTWAMAAAQADSPAGSAHDREAADLFSVLRQFRDAIPAGSRR